MKNICFDLCAIPVFVLIFFKINIKKNTWNRADKIYMQIIILSIICTVTDVLTEFLVNPIPLTTSRVLLGTIVLYIYLYCRNATLVVFLVFLFTVIRTEFRIRDIKTRCLIWLPNTIILIALVQNIFTHNVFIITREEGYSRRPVMTMLYVIALVYGVFGTAFAVYCRRYLDWVKWIALISTYVLTFIAVVIQFKYPQLLVEMFSTSIGVLLILLMLIQPEDTMDMAAGVKNWNTYQTELRNTILAKVKTQILVTRLDNAMEIRSYLGENGYNVYLREIIDEIEKYLSHMRIQAEIFFERPDAFYIMIDDKNLDVESMFPIVYSKIKNRVKHYAETGVRLHPRTCLICYPDDLADYNEIINLGHKFPQLGTSSQLFYRASEIVKSRDFDMVNHINEILNRAITAKSFEMYYQPIYDMKTGTFRSAEALVRLHDTEYGMIPPGIFVPSAESAGLILPIGRIVLDSVFRFISEQDFERLGLSYIEINLSVSQVLQSDLPHSIKKLQEKYGVRPDQVNFEITETQFDNIGDVMEVNVKELTRMGYSFSLDDYGVGYSNIQRLSKLPLRIIKIDKSLVDEMFSDAGNVIIRNTVSMMQGINKELVMEGVETKEGVDALAEMRCDYIQGYYYSKPLPADEFIKFIEERNHVVSEAS